MKTLSVLLRPLSWLYGITSRLHRRMRFRSVRSFPVPIVSVGAITAGGSGKTPVTRELLRLLQDRYCVILLSRGYGRRSTETVLWRPGDEPPDPDVVGDEPALIARSMHNGVLGVGADRAAVLAHILSSEPAAPIVLLDDGFQHARLYRDLDIVIVDDRTAGERFFLPAGYLREKPTALARADILLATSDRAEAYARQHARSDAEIIGVRFRTEGVLHWNTSASPPLAARAALLVTGIARPERVVASAWEAGYRVVGHIAYRDHHRYDRKDIALIHRRAHELAADIVLTTEKDAVKLERFPELRESLYVLMIGVEFAGKGSLTQAIDAAARHRHAQQTGNTES